MIFSLKPCKHPAPQQIPKLPTGDPGADQPGLQTDASDSSTCPSSRSVLSLLLEAGTLPPPSIHSFIHPPIHSFTPSLICLTCLRAILCLSFFFFELSVYVFWLFSSSIFDLFFSDFQGWRELPGESACYEVPGSRGSSHGLFCLGM